MARSHDERNSVPMETETAFHTKTAPEGRRFIAC